MTSRSCAPRRALGVSAQSLHYLNFLIAGPIPAPALYRSGVLVQIPRPERFAVHKLIVADRRREVPDSVKAAKDRARARFLIRVLAEARSRGPRWGERLERSLLRMPDTAALLATL